MNPEVLKRFQILATLLVVLFSGWLAVQSASNPASSDLQARIDFQYHPIARLVGALIPVIICAPFVYWILGRICRRIEAHFTVCEYCAEIINADAKMCRYCGRDIAVVSGRALPNDSSRLATLVGEEAKGYRWGERPAAWRGHLAHLLSKQISRELWFYILLIVAVLTLATIRAVSFH